MSTEEKESKVEVIKVVKRSPLVITARHEEQEFMREFLERIVKEVVSFPEDIKVTFSTGEKTTIYQVDCSKRVLGQIIGASGKNIQSIRTLIQGITARKGFRSIVEIPYFEPDQE